MCHRFNLFLEFRMMFRPTIEDIRMSEIMKERNGQQAKEITLEILIYFRKLEVSNVAIHKKVDVVFLASLIASLVTQFPREILLGVAVNLEMGIVNLVIVDVLRIDKVNKVVNKVNKVVNKVKIVTVEVAVNIMMVNIVYVAVNLVKQHLNKAVLASGRGQRFFGQFGRLNS
ncbi:hypothetical protein C1645_742426 [Glomus cerebriforme]|uniref:Uncharacterized protein n=1 Tax=Glomus cerebriforme TaxID=658196 RepID=A0A397SHC8_9GLOM|nr:hypothetical protein C1645_742426 [Glomus cerebriforme]